MKTSDVLRKAGDVLDVGGWCRGRYADHSGRHCVAGAVRAVGLGGYCAEDAAFNLLDDLVPDGNGDGAVLRWNDRACNSAAEAMQLMDAAYVVALQLEGVEPGDVL